MLLQGLHLLSRLACEVLKILTPHLSCDSGQVPTARKATSQHARQVMALRHRARYLVVHSEVETWGKRR